MSTTPAKRAIGTPPPWELQQIVTHPFVRGVMIVFNWVILDRISVTTAFFQGLFSVSFSFLLIRCSRYIISPPVFWVANMGVVLYLTGICIAFLGMAGWVTTELGLDNTPIIRISSDYRMCIQIANALFGSSTMNLVYIWLPIILAAIFDWAFLKTYQEENKINEMDSE